MSPIEIISPYKDLDVNDWRAQTDELIDQHPLDIDEIKDVVIGCWASIFDTTIGTNQFSIGTDIFPKPQIMGFFIHELIPLELQSRYPDIWRGDINADDKDIVCKTDNRFSIEVKTSSNPNQIFGNRSYAQKTTKGKKAKSGYYLAVNFQKFDKEIPNPQIVLIRFGWVDSDDWIGQRAASGQQSRLPKEVYEHKLIEIYKKPKD